MFGNIDDPKSISLWLKRTANNPDQVDATGRTLLQMAVQFQRVDLVRQALEHGADPNFLTDAGLLPLVQAVSPSVDTESSRKLVQLLLNHGADVTHTQIYSDGQSSNALTIALWRNDLTIAQMLLDAGMEYVGSGAINLKGIGQSTDFTLLETLIDQGLDVNASEGALQISPPLFQAVELENMALARFLLSHGATISADQHQWLLARTSSPNQLAILALVSEQGVQMTVPPGNSDAVR
ncbi:MAG: ankyrin repeat domain-containing protein [Leptolyngbyaceae cyanobacterium]